MARLLSRTLLRHVATTSSSSSSHSVKAAVAVPPCVHLVHRHRSSQSAKPHIIEIELGSASSSPASSLAEGEYELALNKFSEIIQQILVKRATPDWLPFIPGSSFWVPPRPTPSNVVELVEKYTGEFSEEEYLSLATLRGWPCTDFFFKENESAHCWDTSVEEVKGPEEMKVRVEVKVLAFPGNVAYSEDEEG